MPNVQIFMWRDGKTAFGDIDTQVRERLRAFETRSQALDPNATLQMLLTNICASEGVAPGAVPREEEIVRWLDKNGS